MNNCSGQIKNMCMFIMEKKDKIHNYIILSSSLCYKDLATHIISHVHFFMRYVFRVKTSYRFIWLQTNRDQNVTFCAMKKHGICVGLLDVQTV